MQYFEYYKRFHNLSGDGQNRVTNFLMFFDCERNFISLKMFESGFDSSGRDESVSFVQVSLNLLVFINVKF